MRKVITTIVIVMTLCIASNAMAESATPQEVIAKVKEAASYLSKEGESGLVQFNDPNGAWVWKDTYVFVQNCEADLLVAHISNKLIGKNLSTFVDKKGNYFTMEMCVSAEDPNGGWIEYWWPKKGSDVPVRKIAYMVSVPGQPYQVGAGVYDESMSLEDLNALIK